MHPSFFERHAVRILAVLAALVPLIGFGSWHAYDHRDNSVLGWLPERSPVTLAYREFLRDFGPDETVLVGWEGCTLDDPRLERFATAVDGRREADAAAGAPPVFAAVTTGGRLRAAVAAAAGIDAAAAARRLAGVVVGPDGRASCGVVTLHPLDDAGRRAAVDWLAAAAAEAAGLPRSAVRLTGDAVVSTAIDIENERTAANWSTLSMLVALGLACGSLGSLRLGCMVLAVAGYASLASEAAIHFAGCPMNMLVSLVPVVTFVLAISAAVHLAAYWTDALPARGAAGAADAAVAAAWAPSVVSGLTTVLGMASLCVSQVRPVWHFGLFGGLGTCIAFAAVFLGLPALLQCWGPASVRGTAAGRWPALERPVRALLRRHRLTTPLCAAAMLAAGAGLAWMRTEVRPVRFLPPASRWREDLDWFNRTIGPFQTVDVVLTFPGATAAGDGRAGGLADRAALVEALAARLAGLADVRGTLSAATFLPADLAGSAERGRVGAVLRRGLVSSLLRRSLPTLAEAGVVAEPDGRQLWRVALQVENFTAARQRRLEAEIAAAVTEAAADLGVAPPTATRCTGGVPLVIAAQQELFESLLVSFAVAFVTIAAVLAVFFRSLVAGLVAMIPNVFPVVIVFGVLGWLGWPLDVGGMMTASIALGIAVDDTVHLLTACRRSDGTDRVRRVDRALRRCTAPMTRSTIILGGAFAVFGGCGFQPIAQFGLLLAVLLVVALVGDLVQLPALVAGPAGRWFPPEPAADGGRAAG